MFRFGLGEVVRDSVPARPQFRLQLLRPAHPAVIRRMTPLGRRVILAAIVTVMTVAATILVFSRTRFGFGAW